MTTETTRKKPAAKVVGSFEDVLEAGECNDGRTLFVFDDYGGDWNGKHHAESFVLAASELQAWKALHECLGTIKRVTKTELHKRTTQFARKLMEEQSNGETERQKDRE